MLAEFTYFCFFDLFVYRWKRPRPQLGALPAGSFDNSSINELSANIGAA
jgi:hypothetical protein